MSMSVGWNESEMKKNEQEQIGVWEFGDGATGTEQCEVSIAGGRDQQLYCFSFIESSMVMPELLQDGATS